MLDGLRVAPPGRAASTPCGARTYLPDPAFGLPSAAANAATDWIAVFYSGFLVCAVVAALQLVISAVLLQV